MPPWGAEASATLTITTKYVLSRRRNSLEALTGVVSTAWTIDAEISINRSFAPFYLEDYELSGAIL